MQPDSKRSKLITLFLVLCFVGGCSNQGNPISAILPGTYTGMYLIQQGSYTQRGIVTLRFDDAIYEQIGRIEIPADGTQPNFHESGRFTLENSETIVFNSGLEESTLVLPAWWLVGSFKYRLKNGALTLEQNFRSSFTYSMELKRQ